MRPDELLFIGKKKNLMYKEAVGAPFFAITLYYREYFASLEML